MNARFFLKMAAPLCVSLLLAPAMTSAQGTNNEPVPMALGNNSSSSRYQIEIVEGQLLLAPLENRIEVKAIWGEGSIHSVPATIENLAKYLRAADSHLNIVL